ncbi:MAG TPA: diguanylate cyclase, partial [Epsilonproteobacteria bacterium]|nr:diguanylate cyclase [Campylobacterota bacterium]
MTSINTYYTDFPSLVSFIQSSQIVDSPSLLIQIFTAHNDKKYIADLLENLTHLLPEAVIIGSTTDGEIMAGEVSTGQTVLSFTSFEATTLEVALVEHKEDGFCSGKHIGEKLMGKETKLIIAFADGLHTNGDAFLAGLNSVDNTIMVAGGLAGDNATFTNTFVFDKKRIIEKGAVAVALNSSVLSVNNAYNFNWRRIGKALIITKVTGNRVYIIDDRTAVDTYIHYLGQEMSEGLPAVGIEFPLITVRNGIKVARAVLAKHDDGSLSFAGNFEKGDKVQFGYGDPKEIMEQSKEMQSWLEEHPPECTFVYSCMARRHFMPDIIEAETLPLNDIAPVSGFFTYGEFFTSDKKELLNQSMTLVTLSETSDKLRHRMHCVHETNTLLNTSTNALINLINVTSNE